MVGYRIIGWLVGLLFTVSVWAEAPVVPYLEQARGFAEQLLREANRERRHEIGLVGLADTIYICRMTASNISNEISCKHNVLVHRVSVNPRNLGNASPDQWEQQGFQAFQNAELKGEVLAEYYRLSEEPLGAYFRYMKPIRLAGECLPCHGQETQMSAPVLAPLQQYYPYDRARNRVVGELIGAVSVKIKVDAPATQ